MNVYRTYLDPSHLQRVDCVWDTVLQFVLDGCRPK